MSLKQLQIVVPQIQNCALDPLRFERFVKFYVAKLLSTEHCSGKVSAAHLLYPVGVLKQFPFQKCVPDFPVQGGSVQRIELRILKLLLLDRSFCLQTPVENIKLSQYMNIKLAETYVIMQNYGSWLNQVLIFQLLATFICDRPQE